jgi:hypothetical protein
MCRRISSERTIRIISYRVSDSVGTPESRQAISWVGRRINTIGEFPSIGPTSTVLIGSGQLATEASVFQPPLINPQQGTVRRFRLETYLQVCRWNRLLRQQQWKYYIGLRSLFVSF